MERPEDNPMNYYRHGGRGLRHRSRLVIARGEGSGVLRRTGFLPRCLGPVKGSLPLRNNTHGIPGLRIVGCRQEGRLPQVHMVPQMNGNRMPAVLEDLPRTKRQTDRRRNCLRQKSRQTTGRSGAGTERMRLPLVICKGPRRAQSQA